MPNLNKPDIIVIVLDAVRARSVSAYGRSTRTTQHLDAFATEQTVLKDLSEKLQAWRAGLESFPPNLVNNTPKVDAATLVRLRSLGYVE
jgi:hypothetical protein